MTLQIIVEAELMCGMFVGGSCRDTSFARVSLINIIWFVLTLYYLSWILSWTNKRMIQDNLWRTGISLDMKRYFSTYMSSYQHIQALGLPKTNLTSLWLSPSVRQMGKMQPEDSMVWWRNLESIRAFSSRVIDGVIGWVKVGDQWGIVNWCWGLKGPAMKGMVDPNYCMNQKMILMIKWLNGPFPEPDRNAYFIIFSCANYTILSNCYTLYKWGSHWRIFLSNIFFWSVTSAMKWYATDSLMWWF